MSNGLPWTRRVVDPRDHPRVERQVLPPPGDILDMHKAPKCCENGDSTGTCPQHPTGLYIVVVIL